MQKIIEFIVGLISKTAPAAAGANPIVSLALFAVEEAIKQEPAIAAELKTLFASGTPTPEMFAALHEKIASESYAKFVPESAIPATETVTSPVVPPDETVTSPVTPPETAKAVAAPVKIEADADGWHREVPA